jgi:chromosome segregation ATPase
MSGKYEAALTAKDKTIETLREILAAYQQQMKDLNEVSDSNSNVAELEVKAKSLENENFRLMDTNNSLRQEILAYKKRIDKSNDELNEADAFYTTAKEEIATLRKKNSKLKDSKKKLEKKLEKNEILTAKMIEDYDSRLNERNSDVSALRNEINIKALDVSKEKGNVRSLWAQLTSCERMLMYNEDLLSQKHEIECLKEEFLDIQIKEEDEKLVRIRELEDMLHHEQNAREKLQKEREILLEKLNSTGTNNAGKKRMPFFDKGTNNRNNGNPKIMVDGGMYDPLLPSNEYGVNSKSSSPVRTPSRRDSGLGKEVYDDYDDENAESSSCCC